MNNSDDQDQYSHNDCDNYDQYSDDQSKPVKLELNNDPPIIDVTYFSYKIKDTTQEYIQIISTVDSTICNQEDIKIFLSQQEPSAKVIPIYTQHLESYISEYKKFERFVNERTPGKCLKITIPKDNNRFKVIGFCSELEEKYSFFSFKNIDKITLELQFQKNFCKQMFKQRYIHFTISKASALRQLLRELPDYQQQITYESLIIYNQKNDYARVVAPSILLASSLIIGATKLQIQVGDFELSDTKKLNHVTQMKIVIQGDLGGLELQLNQVRDYKLPLRVPYYGNQDASVLIAQKQYFKAAVSILQYETGFIHKEIKQFLQTIIEQANKLNNETKPSKLAKALLSLNLTDKSYKQDRIIRDLIFSIYNTESSKFFTALYGPALSRGSQLAYNLKNVRRNDVVLIDDKIQISQVEMNAQMEEMLIPQIGAQYDELINEFKESGNRYIHSNKGYFIRANIYPKDISGNCLITKAKWRKVLHDFSKNLTWKSKSNKLVVKIIYDKEIEMSAEEFIYSISGYNAYDQINENKKIREEKLNEKIS